MSTRMLLSPWPLAGAMVKTMAINPKPYTLVMVRTKVKKKRRRLSRWVWLRAAKKLVKMKASFQNDADDDD